MPIKIGPLSPLEQVDLYTWAINRRNIRGEDFTIAPPLKALYRDQSTEVYIEKSAQLFVSEYFVNLALFAADTKWGGRGNVLYYFPATPQITDFSATRLDPVIWFSPYLSARQTSQKEKNSKSKNKQNVGLKQVGEGSIYLRGAKTRTQMVSVDADVLIFDEIDLMPEKTIEAGKIRIQSSLRPFVRGASTPMYPNLGVDALMQRSTDKAWMVKCDACNVEGDLSKIHDYILSTHNVKDSLLMVIPSDKGTHVHRTADYYAGCPSCGHILNVWNGRWVNKRELNSFGVDFEGYHLPKLFSNRIAPEMFDTIAKTVEKEKDGKLSDSATQEFYNSICGLPRAPQGIQVNLEHLKACMAHDQSSFDYSQFNGGGYPDKYKCCFMGVDIGQKRNHITIIAYPADNKSLYAKTGGRDIPVVVFAGFREPFSDVGVLFREYDCIRAVIDTQPEYRSTMELCNQFPGRMFGAMYPPAWTHKGPQIYEYDEDLRQVKVSRSDALGLMYAHIFEKNIILPYNVQWAGGDQNESGLGAFPRHLMCLTKVIDEEQKVSYVQANTEDHYAHSLTYAFVAAKATSLDKSNNFTTESLMTIMMGISSGQPDSAELMPSIMGKFRRQERRIGHGKSGRSSSRPSGY